MSEEAARSGMPALSLPPVDLNFDVDGSGTVRVFDPLRGRYVALTPEEYVRQHFVGWMRSDLHYPSSLLSNETTIELNGTRRRCDTVVFDKEGKPVMIVEYKAPTVAVTQDVFDQIYRYNLVLHARYLVVSNGLRHYCCVIDYHSNTYHFIPEIPRYGDLRPEL